MKKSGSKAYDHIEVEKRWQKKWASQKIYKTPEKIPSKKDGKKFYALDMFPYPSGEGLHVGHPKGYIATDIVSRYKRMNGFNVLHPMGFDAFGLPAENYAIKTKTNPADSVKKNVARYKKQLEILGFDYDWSREINTTDPNYYKWTQWIFLQLFKKGLAYESFEPINWCPVDKTGLANEDVENGRCERCGSLVEKRPMRQWVLKITDYADRLLNDLDSVDDRHLREGDAEFWSKQPIPHIIDKKWPPRTGKKQVMRRTIHALVRDPQTNKILGLKWKKFPWITFIVGGVEGNEDIVEAAKREVTEETGYTDLKFVQVLGTPVKAEYFAAHKDQNRVAITSAILFELNSPARKEVSKTESDAHETLWLSLKEMNAVNMTCAELPVWLERLPRDKVEIKNGVYCYTQAWGEDTVRPDKPFVERNAVAAIVKHWSEDKFIGLKWKKVDWQTLITGGAEADQTIEEGAIAEIVQETGYLHPKLIRHLGKVDSKFFHGPKGVNRFAHFDVMYFELTDAARTEISKEDKENHEVVWVSRHEMSEFLGANAQKFMWNKLFLKQDSGFLKPPEVRPRLDWPESIKESQRNWIGRSEGAEIDFRLDLKNQKTRFVIIHGFEGSSKRNFIPWLKTELEKRGFEVETPELPNAFHPKEEEQVDFLINNCKFDENTVVVGHSLGAIVALKTLMKLNKPISGLVLVGPAIDPTFHHAKTRPFWKDFTWDFDYDLVKKLTSGKIAVLSDIQEKSRAMYIRQNLAKKLDARLIESTANKTHFRDIIEPEVLKSVTPLITVFTTRPDTIDGVSYLVLAPEHEWVTELLNHVSNKAEVEAYVESAKRKTEIDRTDTKKEKTGVQLKGLSAINPLDDSKLPIWIADYVLADYGTGAIMGVPGHDERDKEFAEKFGLKIKELTEFPDKKEITFTLGGRWVNKYRLKDWVFSRQRYWGEPIPVIHCDKCGVVPVPEKDLPVKLPKVKSYEPTGTGESPLANIKSWVNVKCPQCKSKARRETNTMPQWAGSSWYYLRFQDPWNKKVVVDSKKEAYWSPVDLYVGGAEHATRHLIYARFWHKFLNDIGVVSEVEPFKKLQNVGLIMGEDGRKMSKRFGNVINPDDIVKTYGADTLRIYEMFLGPFDQQIAWSTESIIGPRRFIERVWKLADKISASGSLVPAIIHKTIEKVSDDIENLRFNTAVSSLMIALNEIEKMPALNRKTYESYLKLLAPFAPHVSEELWISLGNKKSIHLANWPEFDKSQTLENTVKIAVQINGKVRADFEAKTDLIDSEIEQIAREDERVKRHLDGKKIAKIIVVKNRLVNFVLTD